MLKDISRILHEVQVLIKNQIPLFTFIPLITFIVLFIIIRQQLFGSEPGRGEIIIICIILCFTAIIQLMLSKLILKKYNKKATAIYNETNFINLISDNTNEVLFMLDSLGSIINCNSAAIRLLNHDYSKIKDKPFRYIFALDEFDENNFFKRLILDKLNEVFRLRTTELIVPIKLPEFNEYKSIHIRLFPLSRNDNLLNILAVGRLLGNDYITNKWLTSEKTHYIMDNNIAHLHVFCHRLTRNLEGKLTYNQIIYLQVALLEILINAVEHGNLEIDFKTKTKLKAEEQNYLENILNNPDNDKIRRKVFIDYIHDNEKVTYIIQDEGKGFNWKEYIQADPDKAGNILNEYFHGVGLQMAKNAFDVIQYNEAGNQVTLIKHFNKE